MDFVKKNIGLLLFLILCLGGIVYLVILIMGQSKLKQEQLATEKQHVEFFDRLAKENLRLNDENRKKAEGKLAEADKKYIEFRQSLAEKRLVKDDDPDCKAFMQLAPAPAQSEMLVMIEKIFTDNFIKRRMTSMGGDMMGGMGGEPEMMEPDMMGMGGNGMMGMGMQQMMARQAEEKSDTPKKHLLIQGAKVTPYLCFDRYAQMKNGLNKDDMQRIYKQLKVVELVIGLVRQSEVRELQEFDLPKSIEKLEEGDYEWTPMTITVVGRQANVQILLNLLSANENYFFFIRNLELKAQDVLMDQIIEMKQALAREMPALLAAGTSRGSGGMMSMGMDPGTSDTMMMGGMEMEEGMGGMGGRGGRRRGGRRRRPQRPGMGGAGMGGNAMGGMGGPGMMNPGMGGPGMMNPGMGGDMMGEGMGGSMDPYDLIPLTRRDLRVFDAQKDVTVTIRFDLIEFNPMAENN
ncbi:MAG: hypothetical protein K6G44_17620 [Lentisphaeria bacterium]|nr:hypothetical protein [Lentisphaeria bacterium]